MFGVLKLQCFDRLWPCRVFSSTLMKNRPSKRIPQSDMQLSYVFKGENLFYNDQIYIKNKTGQQGKINASRFIMKYA